MTRSLTTALKTELATNDIRPVHLITIGFATPVNITDCSYPLTSSISGGSVTYDNVPFTVHLTNDMQEFGVVGADKDGNNLYKYEFDVEETL